jgi:aspartate/methionine/tyrosine aminotransferase
LQAAVPQILEKTKAEFHLKNLNLMREAADIFYDVCKEIPCLTCPHKPEGAMAAMVSDNDFKLRLQLRHKPLYCGLVHTNEAAIAVVMSLLKPVKLLQFRIKEFYSFYHGIIR